MDVRLDCISNIENKELKITGSKSESNRLLILQALYPEITIRNLSNSDDSKVMQKALQSTGEEVDIHHAGTAMRFLTAYFACKEGREVLLTGSKRMKQRPIKVLVEALRQLGCDIEYEGEEGYPPLRIKGSIPNSNEVSLKADVSSQYISALMLIAPSLPEGLKICLLGKVTSVPYINMTISLLRDIGVVASFDGNNIQISHKKEIAPVSLVVESDWSSASYFYSIVALSDNRSVSLGSYKDHSYQGDASLAEIYRQLGVETIFSEHQITLKKTDTLTQEIKALDLSNSPDIAQTIAVTCFGLGLACYLTGLHTLKIKETDRLEALKTEIEKLGGKVEVTNDTLKLFPTENVLENITINTYDDHRMAMAFAPLALRKSIQIHEAEVVSKSYPDFWSDLNELGFKVSEI
ncbi:3-phosphoshikimate 1-carboxyvinyltransferase [Aquimarina hainanensis]|uniref:3-phosphoshikimate 1-carboxyvinyltransferase n=1 Tax=Aquimarina hainanensis TaxID=1578017 RepID=A0ABW5N934_9FLAO